jgi:hypothetical protein
MHESVLGGWYGGDPSRFVEWLLRASVAVSVGLYKKCVLITATLEL